MLFKCLDVNSDKVKMAVVRCLLVISPEEWSADQLEQLISVVESTQNLGHGNTETILSCIFLIFIKIIKRPDI